MTNVVICFTGCPYTVPLGMSVHIHIHVRIIIISDLTMALHFEKVAPYVPSKVPS